MKADRQFEKPAVELCEEALFLLRRAPLNTWAIYLLGTGPFILAFLYFWTDMTRGIVHETRLVSGSLALTALFIWMKTCQSMFAARLWSQVSGVAGRPHTIREWLAVARAQAALQPWGIVAIPLALVFTIPAAWTYAYYQNATAIGAPSRDADRSLHSLSLEQARLWPKQNHTALGILTILGLIVFIDVLIVLLLLPQAMITLFGVKNVFHPSAWLALNTTFLALVGCLSYLTLDPFVKALYTLRCFYGQSLTTAEDLQARLNIARATRGASGAVLKSLTALLLCLNINAASAAKPVSPEQLDQSITQTLDSSEYNWRIARDAARGPRQHGWLHDFYDGLGNWMGKTLQAFFRGLESFARWLSRFFPKSGPSPGISGEWITPRELLVALAAIVVAIAIMMLLKFKVQPRARAVEAAPIVAIPDLRDEDIRADQLPEDEWLRLAAEMAAQGDLRLAIRALFLSALAILAGRNFIALARFKSNRDYERELRRRAASLPQALAAFGSLIRIYNRIWYGMHEASAAAYAECQASVQALRT